MIQEYQVITSSNSPHVLLDVRPTVEYEICSLPNSTSILKNAITLCIFLTIHTDIPLSTIHSESLQLITSRLGKHNTTGMNCLSIAMVMIANIIYIVYVVCHHGNDSQFAVQRLKHWLPTTTTIKDIIGGLSAWSKQVDSSFPQY